jgi:hypothetical protein
VRDCTCLVLAITLGCFVAIARSEEPKRSDPGTGNTTPNDSMLGLKPPEKAIVLFGGNDLDGWVKDDGKIPAAWTVEDGVLTVKPGQGAIMTKKTFGDVQLHIEFNVPYMPKERGQGRGNSGVFLSGIYEVQVLDSYALKLHTNDCGAIYKQVLPVVNACKPPLQWQSYDITFRRARTEAGRITKKARITVVQNGVKTIDNAEIVLTAGGLDGPEGKDGPLFLQDHHNEVQFRNIWIKPLDP